MADREVRLMAGQLLSALQVLDPRATDDDLPAACRRLFIQSDEYKCALPRPYDPAEVDRVANAIFEYVTNPDSPRLREITFSVHWPLFGTSIEYNEFAATFSEDMLY